MTDTVKNQVDMLLAFVDNATGNIEAQDLRDFVVTTFAHADDTTNPHSTTLSQDTTPTLAADLDAASTYKVVNLAAPTAANDAARKAETDAVSASLTSHATGDGSDHSDVVTNTAHGISTSNPHAVTAAQAGAIAASNGTATTGLTIDGYTGYLKFTDGTYNASIYLDSSGDRLYTAGGFHTGGYLYPGGEYGPQEDYSISAGSSGIEMTGTFSSAGKLYPGSAYGLQSDYFFVADYNFNGIQTNGKIMPGYYDDYTYSYKAQSEQFIIADPNYDGIKTSGKIFPGYYDGYSYTWNTQNTNYIMDAPGYGLQTNYPFFPGMYGGATQTDFYIGSTYDGLATNANTILIYGYELEVVGDQLHWNGKQIYTAP